MAIAVTGIMVMILLFCGIVALLLFHLRRLRFYIKAAKFPGPRTLPIIGNAHYFIGKSSDIVDNCIGLANSYTSLFRLWLGHRLLIVVSDPEQLQIIFHSRSTIEKGDMYRLFRPWLGSGIFTASDGTWPSHRKLISASFNSRILESYVEVFARQSEFMVKQMKKELGGDEFDIYRYVSLCLLDIVCETTMGVTMNAQEKNSRYANAVAGISETIIKRSIRVWLHPDFIFNLTKLGRDQRKYLEYLHGVTNNVVQMKKSSHRREIRVENENAYERRDQKKVFLESLLDLLKDDEKLTEAELREHVDTMMFAGSHSSAMLSMFTMVMLANNPDIQERAYRELCEIYGDQISSETPVKNEDLNRMVYLERIIKETLRLFPVSPVIGREVTEDLNIGGYTLPKGASVMIALTQTHRSEKYWPDPLKFDPDRFLPEEVARRHPYCYMPFSAGPRNCIGITYAMNVMKVVLATVLRRYVLKKNKILDVRDIKLKADILKPVETTTLKISERVNEY